MTLRVALVAGPMYDHLYQVLDAHDVTIEVHADHPTLNARVAQMLSAGQRLDLISTHSKYAPPNAAGCAHSTRSSPRGAERVERGLSFRLHEV